MKLVYFLVYHKSFDISILTILVPNKMNMKYTFYFFFERGTWEIWCISCLLYVFFVLFSDVTQQTSVIPSVVFTVNGSEFWRLPEIQILLAKAEDSHTAFRCNKSRTFTKMLQIKNKTKQNKNKTCSVKYLKKTDKTSIHDHTLLPWRSSCMSFPPAKLISDGMNSAGLITMQGLKHLNVAGLILDDFSVLTNFKLKKKQTKKINGRTDFNTSGSTETWS